MNQNITLATEPGYIIKKSELIRLEKYGLNPDIIQFVATIRSRPVPAAAQAPEQCPFRKTHENNLFACYADENHHSCSYVHGERKCPVATIVAKAREEVLDELGNDMDFLPSSEDSHNVVWVTLRHVQDTINERKAESLRPEVGK